MTWLVDTNLLCVANHKSEQASAGCVRAALATLQEIQLTGRLAVDDGWHIVREYKRNAFEAGQPGLGDVFLRWVLTNHFNPARIDRVAVTEHAARGFAEFPDDPALAAFDPSDRKFVAVALAHPERPPILNATESDWRDAHDALARHGVRVEYLCAEFAPVPNP